MSGTRGRPRDDAAWQTNLERVAEFVRTHERMPRKNAHPRAESRLGSWLNDQRTHARAGRLTSDRSAELDRLIPGWSRGRAERWLENARATHAHKETTGAFPDRLSLDPAERALGLWLTHQRAASSRVTGRVLNDERRAWLNEHLPGWNSPQGKAR